MGDLSGVSPGWRGTDPHGGTWIANDDGWWVHFPAGGAYRQMTWRSQEEAEAAGLVRLIPAVGYHYDERGEDVVPDVEVSDCENCGGQQCMDCSSRAHHDECVKDCPVCCADLTLAAPAPLDPGNPGDLRQVAEFVRRYYRSRGLNMHSDYADNVPSRFEHAATCIERESAEKAREAEQDAKEQALVDRVLNEQFDGEFDENYPLLARGIIAGIRAERARQEEAK